jgi:hypothetical protein
MQTQLACAGTETAIAAHPAAIAVNPPATRALRRCISMCVRARNTIASPTTPANAAPFGQQSRAQTAAARTAPSTAAPVDPNTSPLNER